MSLVQAAEIAFFSPWRARAALRTLRPGRASCRLSVGHRGAPLQGKMRPSDNRATVEVSVTTRAPLSAQASACGVNPGPMRSQRSTQVVRRPRPTRRGRLRCRSPPATSIPHSRLPGGRPAAPQTRGRRRREPHLREPSLRARRGCRSRPRSRRSLLRFARLFAAPSPVTKSRGPVTGKCLLPLVSQHHKRHSLFS